MISTNTVTTALGGPLAIDGVVVDERDAPVDGAAVLVTEHDEVRSSSDGRFHLAEVLPGRYFVNAHSATAAAGPIPVRVDDASVSVVVRLRPGVRLTVEVVSVTDGKPLSGARGSLGFSNMVGPAGQVETTAGADGVLHFPVAALGNYQVLAEADGYAPATRLLTWNDRAGLTWHARMALEPGVVLTGRVVDESSTPVAGAQVTSRPPRRLQTQIPYRPRPPDPMRPPVTTDAEGRFRYPVPAGQGLVLVASHPHYAGGDSGPLVASGPSEVAITLHPGRVLRGRVVDRDRAPIARATVSDGAPDSAPAHVAETDADGGFELAGIAPGGHQTVLYAEAHGNRASPVLVTLPDGFAASIELVVDHDQRIAGTVVDASGAPVGDALVHFQHVVPASYQPPPARPTAVLEPMAAGEVRADGNGSFAISGLAAGEVELLARVPAAASDRAALPQMAGVTARAGDESVVITLPSPARIRGRVVTATGRPATGLEVSLAPFGGPIRVDNADGHFELDQLDPAPGSYRVHIAAAGSAATEVKATVTAGKTTDLGVITLEAGHRLRGRVLETTGGGPVANALISVDGPEGTRVASCRTDELGGFEVAVPDDPVVVHATMAGVGGSRFELVPAARTTVELHLPETGRLEVTVTGAPPTGPVTVAATRTDTNDGGLRIFMLDRDGNGPTFHADVSPGEYVVHASPTAGLAALKNGDIRHDVAVGIAVGQTQRLSMAIAPVAEH